MTMVEKIAKAREKEFDLTKGEVKKVYAAAKKRFAENFPVMTGWFTKGINENGFAWVTCEICDGLTDERLGDLELCCVMWDHRMSEVI